MIPLESLLVTLVKLVDSIPVPPQPAKRPRGRPKVYSDRLFLKALIIMLVRHLHNVHALLAVLAEPTAEMVLLRALLTEQDRYPTRRTWHRPNAAGRVLPKIRQATQGTPLKNCLEYQLSRCKSRV